MSVALLVRSTSKLYGTSIYWCWTVVRIAEFAMEALQVANATPIDTDNPSLGTVNIRIGFHSGSVVADVVGNRNPRYCLFGDAVNTASRMETTSVVNRINCSEIAATLLQTQAPTIPLTSRGPMHVKGKGIMTCYWVNETSTSSATVDRVMAFQKTRFLEHAIQEAGSEEPTEIPEQYPREETLEGDLKDRLSRNHTGQMKTL